MKAYLVNWRILDSTHEGSTDVKLAYWNTQRVCELIANAMEGAGYDVNPNTVLITYVFEYELSA